MSRVVDGRFSHIALRYLRARSLDTMNTDSLQSIWTDVQSSLEAFQADGTEYNRIDALEKATQLARALEKPRDAILKLAYTVSP